MDEPAVYLASGGTTGEPKIIVHNNLVFNKLCAKAEEFLSEPLQNYSALYNVLPIFHGFGLCINMHMCMLMRRTNIMCIKFNAKMSAKQIIRGKANILTGVPTMFVKLLGEKTFTQGDLSHIKDVYVGGTAFRSRSSIPSTPLSKRAAAMPECTWATALTETVTVCLVNTLAHHRENSIGYPLSGTKVRIEKEGAEAPVGEVGEILLQSDQFMLGYLHEQSAPFVTIDGDKVAENGRLRLCGCGRFFVFQTAHQNMIKVSGVPVYPSEIEEVAGSVAGVAKVCAVGHSDEVKGQVVRLFVECRQGVDARFRRTGDPGNVPPQG